MQAMILAAGFGTRLLPHTRFRPKPLFPILNTPLLLLTIKRLQRLGFSRIVVNAHHLADQIVSAVASIPGVKVQTEENILGTGGGLRRAFEHFSDEPLLVSNGDIYHCVDLLDFYRHHVDNRCPVTLAMHDYPRFNQVVVTNGMVRAFAKARDSNMLAFTGLHVIDPRLLERIDDRGFSCIIELYRQLLRENVPIATYRSDNSYWTDMGTVSDYLALHQGLLNGSIPCWREIDRQQQPFCLHPEVKLECGVELCGWAAVGKAHLGSGCRVERSVVWDGVNIEGGRVIHDALISSSLPETSEHVDVDR
jgi:mannose-1-phosphate guanylyltransferase